MRGMTTRIVSAIQIVLIAGLVGLSAGSAWDGAFIGVAVGSAYSLGAARSSRAYHDGMDAGVKFAVEKVNEATAHMAEQMVRGAAVGEAVDEATSADPVAVRERRDAAPWN